VQLGKGFRLNCGLTLFRESSHHYFVRSDPRRSLTPIVSPQSRSPLSAAENNLPSSQLVKWKNVDLTKIQNLAAVYQDIADAERDLEILEQGALPPSYANNLATYP